MNEDRAETELENPDSRVAWKARAERAEARVTALSAELAEKEKDVKRYKWLRGAADMVNVDSWSNAVSIRLPCIPGDPLSISPMTTAEQLDAAIDKQL